MKVRKRTPSIASDYAAIKLQWGRTREGAETPTAADGTIARVELQWGRTREGAETCVSRWRRLINDRASMGPHP